MNDLARNDLLGRAEHYEGMACEDKNKGELGSDLRRMGERLACDYERGATLLRKYCDSGDLQDYRMACVILDGGAYNS